MVNDLIAELRELVIRQRILVIVGAGVSMSATKNAPAASWAGLLTLGAAHCRKINPALDDAWEKRLISEITSGDLDDMLSAAEKISRKLQAPDGGEFRRFLRETVGALQVRDSAVIEALRGLFVPLVTTNYDNLIEQVTGLQAATWRDQNRVFRVLRGEEQAVLHVHGHWNEADSVVLGIRAYEKARQDEHENSVMRSLAMNHSLLFVGCGDGLYDPNFKPFLSWIRGVNSSNEARHYRLALSAEVAEIQKQHPPEERIIVVSYGRHHSALAGFLNELIVPHPNIPSTAHSPLSGAVELQTVTQGCFVAKKRTPSQRTGEPYSPMAYLSESADALISSGLGANPFHTNGKLRCEHPTYVPRLCDQQIAEILARPENPFISITGEFEVGKSSLMEQTRGMLPGYLFFGGALADLRSEDPNKFIRNVFKLFESEFGEILDWNELGLRMRNMPCVLLLDDLGELLEPGLAALMPGLIGLPEKSQGNFRAIATHPGPIKDLLFRRSLSHPKFSRCWKAVKVVRFRSGEILQLLKLLPEQVLGIATKHLDVIIQLSDMSPRRLQCLCHVLFQAAVAAKTSHQMEAIIHDAHHYE